MERSDSINPVLSGKFQITNIKYQTNFNTRRKRLRCAWPKFKVRNKYMISMNKHSKTVWVIGYWNLRFVCNLVLVYWFLQKMQRYDNQDSIKRGPSSPRFSSYKFSKPILFMNFSVVLSFELLDNPAVIIFSLSLIY